MLVLHIYILPVISSINLGTLQNDLSLITQTGFFSLDSKGDMELKELHYLMHFQRDLFGESVILSEIPKQRISNFWQNTY